MLSNVLNIFEKILRMTAWTMEVPQVYGREHLLIILSCSILCFLALKLSGKCSGQKRVRLLGGIGAVLLLSEGYKQLFCYFVLMNRQYDWWIFPFQLCSVPMYLCLLYPFLKETPRQTVDTFLGTFTLIGAVCALAYPKDMLKPYVTLTAHAFLWHFLLLFISLHTLRMGYCGKKKQDFRRCTILFLILAAVAEGINLIGERLNSTAGTYPDMFYINPHYSTGQPGFRTVEQLFGRPVEIAVYLALLILSAWGVHQLYRKSGK